MFTASPRLSLSVIRAGERLPNRNISSNSCSFSCCRDVCLDLIDINLMARSVICEAVCTGVFFAVSGLKPCVLQMDFISFNDALVLYNLSLKL